MRIIPAIETVYAGRKFRSRLEARWAVFMDTLGLEWLYEHEGYQTKAGPYLPDFYLPSMRIHLEIKGTEEAAEIGRTKVRSFRDSGIGAILLVVGPPKEISMGRTRNGYPTWEDQGGELFCWDCSDSSGGQGEFTAFLGADRYDEPVLAIATDPDRGFGADPCMETSILRIARISPGKPPFAAMGEIFQKAVEAANFARFEHGEHGR